MCQGMLAFLCFIFLTNLLPVQAQGGDGDTEYWGDLVKRPETGLVRCEDNIWFEDHARRVLQALLNYPAEQRERAVHLITAPETRLVSDSRGNAVNLLDALRLYQAEERAGAISLVKRLKRKFKNEESPVFLLRQLKEYSTLEEREVIVNALLTPGITSILRPDFSRFIE